MKLAEVLLTILADGRFHSGTELGSKTGKSRAAVWKAIQSLQESGLDIFSVRGKGYRLAEPMEILQQDQILEGMDREARSCLDKLEVFSEIDSTNRYLLDIARQSEAGVQACLAEQQHAGRGRRGRRWQSPRSGNLYLSLLWRFPSDAGQLGGLSLAVGASVIRTLQEFGVPDPKLKWPNDILLENRKLAGILLELSGEAAGPCIVVAGIGLNVRAPAHRMSEVDQPWIDLATVMPEPPDRNRLAARLLSHLILVARQYEEHGFESFLHEWNAHDAYLNKEVILNLPEGEVSGIARGVDQSGALLLSREGKVYHYHSGEVSLRARIE